METCVVVKEDFDRVIKGGLLCSACNSELVAKPVLEIRNEIFKSIRPSVEYHQLKLSIHLRKKQYIEPKKS
jgi:transcription initiation factor IIE alpha subunit